ncbi:MAG: nucleoside kinase [Bacteroides sp.]|nr:nucleoside kinase [Bacteroides sp.]MCM1413862.1 nucleoside kinase [Bacteroides sp.]MCM1471029.1 nucleoside kinase [Bacteroides sp.]
MNSSIPVFIQNLQTYIDIDGGDSLLELGGRLAPQLGFEPINARVNNKAENLNYRVFSPKTVEFMPSTSETGRRTYIRSLCMLLYYAVNEVVPDATLHIAHSLSRGLFCRLTDTDTPLTPEVVGRLKAVMQRLVDLDLPLERHEKRTQDVVAIFREQHLFDKVRLLEGLHELYTTYYSLDGLCDNFYGALAPRTGMLRVFDLIPYHEGMLLLGPADEDPSMAATPIEQNKMYCAFADYRRFNHIVGVSNVGQLNDAVEAGDTPMLINVAEALHNNRIATIADEITERFHSGCCRIVMIAGPSSSGKTTFTKRLAIQLTTNLLEPRMISLDDYFVDRHHTPRDANGDFDYESLYALDLKAFNRDLNQLIEGREVELPYYNFTTGNREYRGNRIQLNDNSILLIEGIHGLNPELTADVDERLKYRVYVSALTAISIDDHNWIPTTDNRLLRRIIRDARYRGVDPTETIRRWPSVRRGEERWIFPYQENADAMFNSSLLFELGVMKHRGEQLLARVPHDVVEYAEAARLYRFLQCFKPISEEFVPSTSLLREFLGGSSFKY